LIASAVTQRAMVEAEIDPVMPRQWIVTVPIGTEESSGFSHR
jgi:hypothetical protein